MADLQERIDELTSVLRSLTARLRAYDASPVKVTFEDPTDEAWYGLLWDGLLDAEWTIGVLGEDGFIGDYEEDIKKATQLGEAFVAIRKQYAKDK